MNYDDNFTILIIVTGRLMDRKEPDCSPHPLDIMAIWAIYQSY